MSSCFPKQLYHFTLPPAEGESSSCSIWESFPGEGNNVRMKLCDVQGASKSPKGRRNWASWVLGQVTGTSFILSQNLEGFGVWSIYSRRWKLIEEGSWGGLDMVWYLSLDVPFSFPSLYCSLPHTVPFLSTYPSTVLVLSWHHVWKDQDPTEMLPCLQVRPSPLSFNPPFVLHTHITGESPVRLRPLWQKRVGFVHATSPSRPVPSTRYSLRHFSFSLIFMQSPN